MGLVFAPMSTSVLANMRAEDHAKASGTDSTLREIGVALGVAVLTGVFTGAGGKLTPTGYVDAAIPAIYVGASVLVLATLVAWLLPSRDRARSLAVQLAASQPETEAGLGTQAGAAVGVWAVAMRLRRWGPACGTGERVTKSSESRPFDPHVQPVILPL